LQKEKARLEVVIQGKQAKLSSKPFISNAPPEIVQRERDGLEQAQAQLNAIVDALRAIGVPA
jgi:valyl-tRNA synthetase